MWVEVLKSLSAFNNSWIVEWIFVEYGIVEFWLEMCWHVPVFFKIGQPTQTQHENLRAFCPLSRAVLFHLGYAKTF
jgi:hypothetical protein